MTWTLSFAACCLLAAGPALAVGPRAETPPAPAPTLLAAPAAGLVAPPAAALEARALAAPEAATRLAADPAALAQAVLMTAPSEDGKGETPRGTGAAFDGGRSSREQEDPLIPVVVVLEDPGSREAILLKSVEWMGQYGYHPDFSFEPSRHGEDPKLIVVRGAVRQKQLGWLRAAKGVANVVPSVTSLDAMAFLPYHEPPSENALRRGARRAFQASEPGAIVASIPVFFAALPAFLSPVAAMGALWNVDRPLAYAIGVATAGLFSIVSPFDQITGFIPKPIRLFVAQGGMLAAAAMAAAQGHVLVAGMAAFAALGVHKAFTGLLAGGYSNAHPVDKFVNGFAVNAAITAIGGAIAALAWSAHETFAIGALAFSIAVFALMGGYSTGRRKP